MPFSHGKDGGGCVFVCFLRRRMFSHHPVGEGLAPSRRFLERPRPAHPRSRTLCHGWSEPGAAVKWHRPKIFAPHQGPVAREESYPEPYFARRKFLRKGIGVSPVNGGLGENELEPEGTCFRRRCESPPAILWFLSHRWERNSPKGRNPPRGMKPVPKPAGGSGDPPYGVSGRSQQNGTTGGASPPLRGGWGDIPWRRTGGRLSELFL